MLFVFSGSGASSQAFVIHDVLVSAADAQIGDFELDPYHKRICWQSITDHKLWVCNLDTITWGLAVPNGKETLVDTSLTPLKNSSNGGEWGFDQSHTYIVYTKQINKTRYVGTATETSQGWFLTTFMDAPHRMNPHASQNPDDSVAAIFYIRNPFSVNTKFKFLDNPGYERSVTCFKDTHWENDDQLLTGILFNHQVGIFDPVHPGIPVQLTFDTTIHYSQPYMWHAPEHGDARMFFARADNQEIHVFKESTPYSNQFRLYLTFQSPSANPAYRVFASPEPIVYQGQSYITFMVSCSPKENAYEPAEIWIAKVDSLMPVYRMVSNEEVGIRTDPESFATDDMLLTYYTEVIDPNSSEPIFRMRQCETGFGPGVMTGDIEKTGPANDKCRVYPNPFSKHLSLEHASGNERYLITNPLGQTIWTGTHIEKNDFSGLKPDIYFLKIFSGHSTRTIKIIKN